MKNFYLLIFALFISVYGFTQKSNPFDQRHNGTRSNSKPGPILQNAGLIDGSKIETGQNFLFKPSLFVKPSNNKDNIYFFLRPSQGATPTVIYKNKSNAPLTKTSRNATGAAFTFLNEVKEEMQIKNPDAEFLVERIESDELGMTHIRMQQQFENIPLYGCEIMLHGDDIAADYMNGNYFPTPSIHSTIPGKSAGQAVTAMSAHINTKTRVDELSPLQKQILNYEAPRVTLVILPIPQSKSVEYKLVYHIMVRPNFIELWNYFVDADNLEILDFYNVTCYANGPRTATASDLNSVSRTINTYEYNGKFYCVDASRSMFNSTQSVFPDNGVGVIETFNANNTDGSSLYNISTLNNTGWNATAVSAHYNAGIAYDYYKTTFNRNSINGSGGTITSIINVTQNGQPMDNAYWNGAAMFYGNGNIAFKPLAGAIDVGGHEMTHGVIQATANLEYKSQSGAINESMADVFGCMMDKNDWQMGEDITKTSYISTGCLRDLSNPHNGNGNGYQPATMSEYDPTTQDNGGVHTNSGIPNHAFYYYATAVTKPTAEKVYYRALTMYLTKTSKFLDLRYAIVKAATDLYGSGSVEVSAAKTAFDQVEIFDPNGNGGGGTGGGTTQTSPDDLLTNPGQDYLLSYDVTGGLTKLYRSSTTGTNYVGLTTTDQNRRVTVPDNGAYCLFPDLSGNIRKIDLTASPYTQTTIYTGGDIENISISKDGKLMAAVSTSIDTAIFIYNFALSQWKKFHLYNPTYSGVNSGGVNYADGLEWDNTGQYVIYDAHNVVKNNSGTDLTYWDVGILKVWDLKSNNWGDGTIEKLFTNLPEGVSIGNPIFSKNSPYIIAFDYIDNSGVNTDYAVLGTNIISNSTKVIVTNSKLGFPNYSKTDSKLIVDGEDALSNENIYVMNLNADKISISGTASLVIPDAKWGYWYATGNRSLLSSSKDILAFSISNTNPITTAVINGTGVTAVVPANADITKLIATFSLSYDASAKVASIVQLSGVTSNNFTNNVNYMITAQDGSTKNYTVTITKGAIGINQGDYSRQAMIYPNPFGEVINIEFKGEFSFELLDLSGKNILEGNKWTSDRITIDTREIKQGIYFMRISNDSGNYIYKMIKE